MTNPATSETDLIVIGGGGAGLATAVAAAEGGANVLLLERGARLGGTTSYSVGSMTAADSVFQRRKGIVDNPADLVEDMWKFDEKLLTGDNPTLRALYARESSRTLDWLIEHGVQFTGPFPEAPHRVPRMHNVIPSSRAYIARLSGAAQRAGVTVRLGAEVTALHTEQDRVAGVVVLQNDRSETVGCRHGVVLATGDFSANADMRVEYLPRPAQQALPINSGALGIGHRLAASVGGELLRMDQLFGPQLRFAPPEKPGLLDRLPLWSWFTRIEGIVARALPPRALRPVVKSLLVSHMSPTDALFAAGAILVDSEAGSVDVESSPAAALAERPGGRGFILLDQRIADEFDRPPHHISTAPGIAFAYFTDYRKGRPDLVHSADSSEKLAAAVGIPAGDLAEVLGSSGLQPPFVAMGPVFSMLTVTEGSVSIDERLRVLRADHTVVDGLYAVGAVGQGGMLMKGHGHHIGWVMTSGRLLGESIAAARMAPVRAAAPQ